MGHRGVQHCHAGGYEASEDELLRFHRRGKGPSGRLPRHSVENPDLPRRTYYLTDDALIQYFEVQLDVSNALQSFDESQVMELSRHGADRLYTCLVSPRDRLYYDLPQLYYG